MANGLHHFASQYFESDTLTTLQFGSVVSFFCLKGKSMESPTAVSTADWSTQPADQGVLWLAGATISPSYSIRGKSPATGSSSKFTGVLLSPVSATIPPDLPILGRGGSYEITFGMYNQPPTDLSISTEGLLSNTLIQGRLLA